MRGLLLLNLVKTVFFILLQFKSVTPSAMLEDGSKASFLN